MQGIYIHIPFCVQKCYYCDFHSVVPEEHLIQDYLQSLKQEMRYYGNVVKGQPFSTVYVGGGTPSILTDKQLAHLFLWVSEYFELACSPEITIEANPRTLTPTKVQTLRRSGVNRVSLGVQAFQDHLLEVMGRAHCVEDGKRSVRLLQNEGISNINLDLIYGLPGQTLEKWQYSLTEALSLSPAHLSCYGLTVEDGTRFGTWAKDGRLAVPDEDDELAMYQITGELLPAAGYMQYEISSYAATGRECRHNQLYWTNRQYLGLGSGAHGFWEDRRYHTTPEVQHYIDAWRHYNTPPVVYSEAVSTDQAMDETMWLGLRMCKGVEEGEFMARFGVSYFEVYPASIAMCQSRGLLECHQGCIRLTEEGMRLGNLVFSAFIRQESGGDALDKNKSR